MASLSIDPSLLEKFAGKLKFPPPVAELIGFNLIALEPGVARFELETDERHANPMGTLHGGILCDLADAAMGTAYASLLEPGESFTTLEPEGQLLEANLESEAHRCWACRQRWPHGGIG